MVYFKIWLNFILDLLSSFCQEDWS